MSQITAAWLRLPLTIRKLIVDFVETFTGLVIALNLFVPGSLDEAKAQAVLIGGAAGAAAVSAFRRAWPSITLWLRRTFPLTILRLTVAAIVAIALMFVPVAAGVGPASVVSGPSYAVAGTQGMCPSDDLEKVRFYENGIGDGGDNNDTWWRCVASDADIGNDTHTLPGLCKAFFKAADNWEDCISSVQGWIPAGRYLQIWENPGYSGDCAYLSNADNGVRYNLPVWINDTASAYRFADNRSTCSYIG